MEKIPTAEEYVRYYFHNNYRDFDKTVFTGKILKEAMDGYSKLKAEFHVKACKEAIKQKGQMEEYGEFAGSDLDYDSIDNAYPLNLIT